MSAPDDDLSAAEEAAVRARLAEARHTGPVPDDVAARLDAVLADLVAERRAEAPADARVVPLPTPGSRRRRALATGLVAAAAVVALGVALPQVLETGGSGDAGSASTADDGGSLADRSAGAGSERSGAPSAPAEASEGQQPGSAFGAPLALTSGEPLRPAIRALVRRVPLPAYDADTACAPGAGPGDRVAATWDGQPAVVVLRAEEDGRRRVEVWTCGSGEVVDRTSVRVP